ncbi:MAG TPA: LPS export ABC transporter permease LptG [Solimonas sp.]
MSLITRHLVAHILGFTAIVGLALVAIYTFISFVAEIDEAGQGGFGIAQLLAYSLLMMPAGLYTLMPVIALLGTLMGLGALASQNEITAMRAGGVTLLRIGAAALLAGILLGGLAVMLGDWLAPAGTQAARNYRSEARSGVAVGVAARPIWLRDGEHVLHIRRLLAEDHIAEIEIYSLHPDLSLASVMRAGEGRYENGGWQLRDVRRTRFEDGRTVSDEATEAQWPGRITPEVLRLFVLEANSLSTPGLMRLIDYMDVNGLDAGSYRLSLWRKLMAPLTVMAMMLFAVPFVLGSQRDSGAGQRVLIGILIGLGFYVVNEVTASLGQLYAWPPVLAAGLPTLLLATLAVQRLRRAR